MFSRQMPLFSLLVATLSAVSVTSAVAQTVDETMDAVVSRLYAQLPLEKLYALEQSDLDEYITPDERRILATRHWSFDVDKPVVVYLMRNVEQKIAPFWIEDAGFTRTDLRVTTIEDWVYEVWRKEVPAGTVQLGINGFDNFRPHYFVAVGAQAPGADVALANFLPEDQTVLTMEPGAMVYHDWTENVLQEVPEEFRGLKLLTTIRGRSGEAALIGSFRETPFPSSETPDPIYLTWSDDPRTTQNIQWRTNTSVADGVVKFRPANSDAAFTEAAAAYVVMDDLMLANDRKCHWFTAVLTGLQPGTEYEYMVGSAQKDVWSEPSTFRAAPENDAPFTFFFCTDTHSDPKWGELMAETFQKFPEAAFVTISGDLVGTGLEREDWDMFLEYGEPVFRSRPVMPAIGNHDAQLGLGAGMYLDIFGLPENGPDGIPKEAAYTFTYGSAQFFILDVMSERDPQTAWLREQLSKSDAKWKIAVFHFPFYSHEENYPDLEEAWGSLFDEFHLDLALTGHIHTHMRTYPMRDGKVVDSPAEGTIYVNSISKPGRFTKPDYAAVWLPADYYCNVIRIAGEQLQFHTVAPGGYVRDAFTIEK